MHSTAKADAFTGFFVKDFDAVLNKRGLKKHLAGML
jgi:hypothetical protein